MKLGLPEKISLTIMLVSMGITTVLSVFFYTQASKLVKKNYSDAVVSGLEVCADIFDDTMRDAYYACVYAVNDAQVKQAVERADNTRLEALLENYRRTNRAIDSICCYIPQRNEIVKVNTSGETIQRCDASMQSWIAELLPAHGANPFAPVYVRDQTSVVDKELFLYSREIAGDDGQPVGQIFVGVDERTVFFDCLQNGAVNSEGERYITSGDEIVSAADIYRLGTKLELDKGGLIITQVDMKMTGHRMISAVEADTIVHDLAGIRNRLFLVTLLLNVLCSIPVFWLVRRMMHPMEELRERMQQVSDGDLKVRAQVYEQDEIGQLSQGFNDMVAQIEQLIEQLVTEQMLKKEAEIEALQYQITPHFMYNTLNSIKYAASLQGSEGIASLLEAFIELLQLSASDRGAFISVQKEMHMVQNYVKLQQFRYADSFTVRFDIQPESTTCYVPRLLVQPLVENAILHGINHKQQQNMITISAMCDDGRLSIKITDNGMGMTAEDIRKLMEGKNKSKFSGIGVSNVRERLHLYYGQNGTLQFFSAKGVGTTALITLPMSYHENEYTI